MEKINTTYMENTKMKLITTIIYEEQMRRFGHISRINEEELTSKYTKQNQGNRREKEDAKKHG